MFKRIEKNLRESFIRVKEELNDHLTAINENTNEIQANYEQLCALDNKIEKLEERMDEIQMLLRKALDIKSAESESYKIIPLKQREKEVFQALSSIQDEGKKATYEDLAKRCMITPALAMSYISSMIAKGIPIVKRYVKNVAYISLDEEFRDQQIKSDIIGISKEVSRKSERWQ